MKLGPRKIHKQPLAQMGDHVYQAKPKRSNQSGNPLERFGSELFKRVIKISLWLKE